MVKAYAERIPRKIPEIRHYREPVKTVIGKKSGIYVLTEKRKRKERLYYVGVASKLPKRLARHLKDRHREGWNQFSFYRIGPKYLRQVESLLIRVARPRGNSQKGSLGEEKGRQEEIGLRDKAHCCKAVRSLKVFVLRTGAR